MKEKEAADTKPSKSDTPTSDSAFRRSDPEGWFNAFIERLACRMAMIPPGSLRYGSYRDIDLGRMGRFRASWFKRIWRWWRRSAPDGFR